MTGPEHYSRAEELIAAAEQAETPEDRDSHLRFARLLAALAQAAATAIGSREGGMHEADFEAWDAAAGSPV